MRIIIIDPSCQIITGMIAAEDVQSSWDESIIVKQFENDLSPSPDTNEQ